MEGKVMMKIYSGYPVLVDLIKLREDPRSTSAMKDQIQIIEQGLQFLVIYWELLSLLAKGERPEGKYLNFGEMSRIDVTRKKKGISKLGVLAMKSGKFKEWDTLASKLLDEINSYKPSILEDCSFFAEGLYSGYSFSTNFLVTFMRYTDVSMTNVLQLKGDMVLVEKMKFESLKEKLNMLRMVFHYLNKNKTKCLDFKYALNAWVWNAAYLCLLYWVLDENMASEGDLMLSKMYRNFDFPHPKITEKCLIYLKYIKVPVEERCKVGEVVSPEVTRMCLSYLKAIKPSTDKRHEAIAIVFTFIESLHSNLRVFLPNDANEMLCDTMLFLIAFVIDPPFSNENEGLSILTQTQEALKVVGSLIISLGSGEKDGASIAEETNFLLHDLYEMVITIKAEVRQSYSHLFLDPSFNLPWINVLNLFASSIENLKELRSHFSNHPFCTIENGLVVLREILEASKLKDNFLVELKNEHIEWKDLWTQISNVAYQADRIIRSYTYQYGLGLDIVILFDVKNEIKNLLQKVKRIKFNRVQDSYTCKIEMISNPIVHLKFDVQDIDEVVVGFEGKAKEIRDWLTNGVEKLDIISIIGMAGQGKTTLANKVYIDPLVKRHFTTCAWITVSQSYDSKKLLLDILKDVTEINDSFIEMEEEDKVIKVQKLVNLWVSEGLIPKKYMKGVEIVAKEYVMDLIGRSLLIVCNKSSSGGIKACRIHDFLREFCLEKSEEE